ncbi:MAG: twin-arginine translocation (Tat) [Bradyrhizobium sp.]|nr:twin-arginine translocation (Tat) [Bradyrhizobium sp.]THD70732.1 MAG: twin-arginine translocation (Tat) [Bradyrhizobium sp.]
MERRHFLKLTFGFVAGAAALAASAKAAPLPPISAQPALQPPRTEVPEPAVVTQDDVDHLKPEEVRWGRHGHGGWHHRHWGWRRHHWRRRHWGWRRRHWGWHRHRWHRRHWGWHRHHWRRHRW